jgi:hypothetical protein
MSVVTLMQVSIRIDGDLSNRLSRNCDMLAIFVI